MFAYAGSFSYDGDGGITVCTFDPSNGSFDVKNRIRPEINAGFVCVRGNVLTVTDERDGQPGKFPPGGGGRVYQFLINPQDGSLTEIGCARTLGVNPSHVTFDDTGKYAIVTHFAIGPMVTKTVKKENGEFDAQTIGCDDVTCLFAVKEDGTLGKILDIYWHRDGFGPMSMIHKANHLPGWNLYAENDLGADRVYWLSIDYEHEKLAYKGSAPLPSDGRRGPGPGPRHGAFHPTLPVYYINYERKGAVTAFDISDPVNMTLLQDCVFVPQDMEMGNRDNQSELMFSADGKQLYTFLRGKGYAAVFDVNQADGTLVLKQFLKLPGDDPRGAAFSPDGRFVLMAGHDGQQMITLKIEADGTLSDTGLRCEMKNPACVAFYEP